MYIVQILLIVILLGEKMNPDIPMPSFNRNIHWKGKFLEGKSRRIFEFEKPA